MPQIQGSVLGSLPTASIAAGSTVNTFVQGKLGELAVSQTHGRLGLVTSLGNVFVASTAAAGVTIPISSATAPTFTLYNPIGSNVQAELLMLNIGITNATTVVSPLLLGYSSGLTAATAPSSTTARAVTNAKLGGAASVSQFYTAATITAATTFVTIGSVSATSGAFPNFNLDLMGSLILTPGSFVHVCGTAAQSSASSVSLWFAEFPL